MVMTNNEQHYNVWNYEKITKQLNLVVNPLTQ